MPHLNKNYLETLYLGTIEGSEPVNHAQLSPFQRVMLVADGTLTHAIEAWVDEAVSVCKLNETTLHTKEPVPLLQLDHRTELLQREILLKGSDSNRTWLYACSFIVLERISAAFRDDLMISKRPIGKLWRDHRTENYKEIVSCCCHPALELAQHFNLSLQQTLLSRTYRVFNGGKPVMMITEKLPLNLFR